MRNGYRTGHADVSCMYFLIDAFCYSGTGLGRGRALNGARSVTIADDSFTRSRHVDASQITCSSLRALVVFVLFCIALQTPTNSSTELPTVHTLDKHSARTCHFLLSKHKQELSYRKSMYPSCPPAAGPLQRKYKSRAGLGVTPLRTAHGTFEHKTSLIQCCQSLLRNAGLLILSLCVLLPTAQQEAQIIARSDPRKTASLTGCQCYVRIACFVTRPCGEPSGCAV